MFGFKSAVNRFMAAQIQINAEQQRTVNALLETNGILMERMARLENSERTRPYGAR